MASRTTLPSTARRLPLLLAALALSTGLAACGSDDGDSTSSATTEPATTQATTASTETDAANPDTGCKEVDAPEPRTDEPDLPEPRPARLSGKWTVTFATSCGSFSFRLDTARQPKTAASVASLVKAKFFDGLSFHRIAQNPPIIQGGDPTGQGAGGPGYSVVEAPPKDAAYTRGIVAMAKTAAEAPGTSGSQFFVVTGADAGLPPDYAIAGKITEGIDVAERINQLGTAQPTGDGPPAQVVVIEKATLKKG
ncbi:peptidylprolyl isomerase [Patulibacter defluvii]|uniref:peptidylprolyl isomerase n=1 Tax=Patulibacter defluvii TaxID=3095358 RepID=UPI002A75A6B1|nr:peptidylprolyl isomerase [Patulibacter sp. DM4]